MPPLQYWFTGGALGAFLGALVASRRSVMLGIVRLSPNWKRPAARLRRHLFYSGSSPKSKIRNWIEGRMRRISELLKRTDTLNPRSDFEPAKFE